MNATTPSSPAAIVNPPPNGAWRKLSVKIARSSVRPSFQ